jgi:diacylglycerol kinase (ATP)
MKNVFIFGLAGGFALYWSVTANTILPMIVLADVGIAFIGVGLAFMLKTPGMFMKADNGQLSFLSYLIFWPYLTVNYAFLRLYRFLSQENPIDEILPGLYLGRKLCHADKGRFTQVNINAVVDVTSEWSEARFILKNYAYLCVPVLDMCAPTRQQLHEAVAWIKAQLKHGGVFVHCAAGHGRSATIVAAYLLHTKKVTRVQEAIDFIKNKRPKISLVQRQLAVLQEYIRV